MKIKHLFQLGIITHYKIFSTNLNISKCPLNLVYKEEGVNFVATIINVCLLKNSSLFTKSN